MNFQWTIPLLIIGMLSLPLKAADNRHSVPIKLAVKERVELRHQGVLWLKDLVEFETEDTELKAILRQVKIGQIPEPGEKLVFTHSALSQIFRAHLGSKYQAHFNIPGKVKVKNVSHLLDHDLVKGRLVEHWQKLCGDCELSILEINIPSAEAHEGSWRIKMGDDLPRGSFSVPLEVFGKGAQTYWVHGHMEVRRLVPVSRRALGFGERIAEDDVSWEMRDVTLARDSVPLKEQLVGGSLRSAVGARSIIYASQLDRPRAIRRGQLTRVIKGGGAWQVSTQALAEQDGFVGDRVTLRHPQTQRLLSGLIVAEGKVELK